ncbi:hypothetical protein SAMN05216312_103544 [Cohnella sp. OV330]|uniref:hypothetical protein n=1 Tax=Cohnella sp. OV330 TaxID=1855288 RepID=UPI0008EEA504|nr:hypothetical protein [Cohnella sp. OV330]SFB10475.1 hypothetical protein SAMN05216312_103544 [Cohnella sp. OV330]
MTRSFSPPSRTLVPEGFASLELQPGQSVRFDFGLKRAGLLHVELSAETPAWNRIRYTYASDERQFSSLYRCFEDEGGIAGRFPSYVRMRPYGTIDMFSAIGNGARVVEKDLTALRYFELDKCALYRQRSDDRRRRDFENHEK